ncbi:MAG: DUF4430 domain-containing protein [Clostridia bacterium]|nr:DUF4430 domain-containing protein [Clostridia bacterium]
MNKTNKNKKSLLSFILCTVLIAALALCIIGCTDSGKVENPETSTNTTTVAEATEAPTEAGTVASDVTVKGEGATVFYFNVVDADGNTTKFEIHTDATTVGEALLALELIEGEDGAYGLYVKKVNGITADYDTDGTYWAFYIGDDYGMTGVDLTEITPGATYAFKVSK